MTSTQLLVIAVVALTLIPVLANRMRIDVAALLMAAILGLAQFGGAGVLGPPHTPHNASKAVAGLGQPVVITLVAVFIISRALDKTGFTHWIARRLLAIGGKSEWRLMALFASTTALLSLVMNNLAAGALLLPSAMEAARRTGIKPSKLLIPVAYGSLLGGVATYFTTANIIVSDLLTSAEPAQAPLNILDFTPTGGLIALAGIAFISLFGPRLLPDRVPLAEQLMVQLTGSELEEFYQLDERLWDAQVLAESPFAGKTLAQIDLGEQLGVAVAAIWRGHRAIFAPPPTQVVQTGDVLLVVGRQERVDQLAASGCKVVQESNGHVSSMGVSFVEVILPPHSKAAGKTLKELDFRNRYGLTAVALWREGRSYRTDVGEFKLNKGDSLLTIGPRSGLRSLRSNPDFIVLEPDPSDQPVKWRHAAMALAIIAGTLVTSALGLPIYLALLVGAVITIMSGLMTMDEAYRAVEWQVIILVAGMYSVSLAILETGLARMAGEAMISLVTPFGPLGLAAGAYLLTTLLTQFMGGQVTALVTGPIAITAALSLGANPQAIAVATALGCSAGFFTPIAHPVNMLMIAPGNYEFRDFARIGWGLLLVCFAALLVGMVRFWGL